MNYGQGIYLLTKIPHQLSNWVDFLLSRNYGVVYLQKFELLLFFFQKLLVLKLERIYFYKFIFFWKNGSFDYMAVIMISFDFFIGNLCWKRDLTIYYVSSVSYCVVTNSSKRRNKMKTSASRVVLIIQFCLIGSIFLHLTDQNASESIVIATVWRKWKKYNINSSRYLYKSHCKIDGLLITCEYVDLQ